MCGLSTIIGIETSNPINNNQSMNTFLNLAKQRRVWASFFAIIAFVLPLLGVNLNIDQDSLTDAFVNFIEALSGLLAVLLPIWSYFFPKE